VIVTVGLFNELNCCTIVDYLNIWINPIKALAGIDESPSERLRQDASGSKWRYFCFYSDPKVKKIRTDERDVSKIDRYKLSLNFV
jgi:hypothetical protein